MPDDFAVDASSSYSVDKYYVGASDLKGHNTSYRLRISPQVAARISALVADKAFPIYRTPSDFMRDALVHRLHQLSEMMKDSAPVMSGELNLLYRQMAAESDIALELLRIQTNQDIYDETKQVMRHPPEFTTTSRVRKAIAEVSDPDMKADLNREFERYQARYPG